jgi:hypothetical protein
MDGPCFQVHTLLLLLGGAKIVFKTTNSSSLSTGLKTFDPHDLLVATRKGFANDVKCISSMIYHDKKSSPID